MKRIMIIFVALVLFMILPQTNDAAKLQESMIPEGTQWVLHFDVDQFLSTQIAQMVLKEHSGDIEEAKKEVMEKLRMDPFKDFSSITVFGEGTSEKNAVVCIRGKFDQKHILSMLKDTKDYKKSKYGRYIIHKWEKSQCGVFAAKDLAIMAQNEGSLKRVLDVIKGKRDNIRGTSMMKQLQTIPRQAFLKAVINNVSDLAGMHSKAMILKNSGAAHFVAMEKGGVLGIRIMLTTGSSETATNIDQMVKGLLAMARMGAQEKELPMDIVDALHSAVNGKEVELEFKYPSKKLYDFFVSGKKKLKIKKKH